MPSRASKEISLPLLPLFEDRVLLPGGFLRLTVAPLDRPELVRALSKSSFDKNTANETHPREPQQEQRFKQGSTKGAWDVIAAPIVPKSSPSNGLNEEAVLGEEEGGLDLNEVHNIGCAARVVEMTRMRNDDWTLVLEGCARVAVHDVSLRSGGVYVAMCTQLDNLRGKAKREPTREELAGQEKVLKGMRAMFAAMPNSRPEVVARTLHALKAYGPSMTADIMGALLARSFKQRLTLLSTVDVSSRLRLVDNMLQKQLEALKYNEDGPDMDHPSLQSPSLGRKGTHLHNPHGTKQSDLDALFARLQAKNPPAEVLEAAKREIQKIQQMNEQHPSHVASVSFVEILADLPWSVRSSLKSHAPTLSRVRHQLDSDHYGLDKVKERMIQFVAVQSLRGWDARAPVLCLVGPPGVGKTSLARSIASALRRPFQRISLGGVRDEAEIRGHRRTYVGALPGRIIAAMRKAKASDPVVLFDEVDKTGKDARGDPAAALLEVLDPEQNHAFVDTYLGLPVDLSRVIFIATANTAAEIPAPLLDRMEIVNIHSYTLEEKLTIGERYLVPRALEEHGIQKERLIIPRDVIQLLIEGYTREAGVRQLDRYLASICRHVAVQLVSEVENRESSEDEAGLSHVPHSGDGNTEHSMMRFSHRGSNESDAVVASMPPPSPPAMTYATACARHMCNGASSMTAGSFHQASRDSLSDATWSTMPHELSWGRDAPTIPGEKKDGQGLDEAWPLLGPGSMGLVALKEKGRSFGLDGPRGSIRGSHSSSHPSSALPPSSFSSNMVENKGSSLHPESSIIVDESFVETILGPRRFRGPESAERVALPGAAAGLVWTAHGGQVQFIECLCVGVAAPGKKGTLTLTGRLGDVLEESARIAVSWARAHALNMGMEPLREDTNTTVAHALDVHIHLPSGGVPKDGPSAGVTLAVALVSLFTGRRVRADTALTGELTLRGIVLPVGGIKEKVMAAEAAGLKRVILPAQNEADAKAEVPSSVLNRIELVPVQRLEQCLAAAFDPPLSLAENQEVHQYYVSKL